MNKNLNIQIKDKIATLQNGEDGKRPFIVCGNSDYTITFHFDDDWDTNGAKTARFTYNQNEEKKAENIPFTGDTVKVPKLLKITRVSVGVFAGDLETTTPAVIVCLPSILCDDGMVPDPEPEVYNEIMELINGLVIKGVPDEKIMEAVNLYLDENGFDVLPEVNEDDNGKVLQVDGGQWVAKELPESGGDNDEIFPWAKQELFSKADLVDPAGMNSFIVIDGVEYYRYHCSLNNFEWKNPKPYPGAVTITARAVAQYGGTGGTRLKTVYDDETNGPDLYVIDGGESRTVTVTTDANKTLAKITGNYDMENWALLDLSVMSCIAGYNTGLPVANAYVPGGVVADPVQAGDTKPVRIGADGRLYTEPDGAVSDEKITEAVNQYLDENGVESLPAVTETDNGKALQVENGKWVAKDLPEGGGASGDYIQIPSTAKVGQTIVVKAVDDNGKPTEWEAADMASGGWKHICDIKTTEEIDAGIEITEDKHGVSFDDLKYNELWITAKLVGVSTNTDTWWSCIAKTDINISGVTASSYGPTSNTRYMSFYLFILGGKTYFSNGNQNDPFCITGGNQDWLSHFLSHYNADHFVSLNLRSTASGTSIIGVDSEIRVLGRRVENEKIS